MTPEQEKLVLDHLQVVKIVASKLVATLPSKVSLDDLVASGNLALVWCALHYDSTRDSTFYTYARKRIKGEMFDYLRSLDFVSRDLRRCVKRLEALAEELYAVDGTKLSNLTVENVLKLSGRPRESVLAGLSLIYNAENKGHFDPIVKGEEGDEIEYLRSPNILPDVEAIRKEARNIVRTALRDVPTRYRLAADLYYYDDMTMKEAAEVMGVNESRVCQILKTVRSKCRESLASSGLSSTRQITA